MAFVHTEAQAVQAEQMYNARYRPDQYQGPPQGFGYGLGMSAAGSWSANLLGGCSAPTCNAAVGGSQYQGGSGGGGYGQQGASPLPS